MGCVCSPHARIKTQLLAVKHEGKVPLGRHICRFEYDNIKMCLK
jgi:hypothetical protein